MKRLLAALLLPVAMLTTPCEALSPEAADDRPSRLRVAAFLMPPLIEGTTAAPSGPFVDYLRRIEALSGVAMDVTLFDSPQRAAEAMATGRFDAVAPSVRTPERERHLAFGEPLAKLPVAILTSRPAVREAVTIADLAGKRVAVAIPSFVDAAMAHAQPEALYVRLASPEEALTSVALGNADYAVVELAHATRLAARIGLPNLHVVGRVPFFYEPAIGIRHDAPPAFKAAVLSATAAMTSDERERLLHGWLTESEIARQPDDGHRIALGVAGASALLLLAAYGLHRRRLRRQTEIYDMLASNIDDIVTVRRNDARRTFLYGSPSLSRLTGFSMRELAAAQLAQLLHPDDLAAFREHRARIDRGDALATVTHRLRRKDGSWLWLETRSKVYRRPNGNIDRVVSLSRDITERRQTEERIRHLACHDPLTDLPNRVAVTQHLQAAIARARTVGRSLALCCLDADSFKHVNDSRGHAAGDATLRAVAMRLRDRSAPDAFIARLGGDEFVVLHENLAVESEADTAAAGLAHLFVEPLMVDGEPVYLTVSVGVALHPQHAATADALLAAADTAMYAAKTAGRNTWRRFSGEMGALLQRRAEALQQLRQAYEQKRLLLHYQPKIDLASGRCVGVEALLRVQTAQGIRGPAGLIEAAEESGFISTLGDWVIETAMAQSRAWRHDGITLPIAVNVSTRQLQDPRFIAWMQEQVQRDPQLPALLDLEITESALASDARAANDALTALHGVGFRLSVDDFGTGYSSLAYLAKMPVQTLKIDRSFVAGLPDAHDSREIVRAVIALARAMQLAVIAEGVETAEQAAFLHEAGCEQAQGYLFARPGPAAQAAEFFAASGAATAKVANLAAFRIQSGR